MEELLFLKLTEIRYPQIDNVSESLTIR